MAQLIKQWENGGNLSATYEGSGDGEAVFSSDTNEGIDREMSVTFKGGGVSVERKVTQEGLRQRFITADGKVFCIDGGGRFAVLKVADIEPDSTYTRLTYIECTGEQYIDLNYIAKESDIITIKYAVTNKESGRMYGCVDSSSNSVYWSLSADKGYARFGSGTSTTIANGDCSSFSTLKKGTATINTWETSLTFKAMPTIPMVLFACRVADMSVDYHAIVQCMGFTIEDENGEVMNLEPHRRDSDGKVGMLDTVSGKFYTNAGVGADFIAGSDMVLPSGYEWIDGVEFNADKLFDAGVIDNNCTIDVMFQRTSSDTSDYLYGIITTNHAASVTAYLASNGAWRWGNYLVRPNTADRNVHRIVISNGVALIDGGTTTFTKATFTTPNTVMVGGYRETDDTILPTFKGSIYHFRVQRDGELIYDWKPCKRLSDGVEGFWDNVNRTFVYPIGSHGELQYLESTGTQYIDTGVTFDYNKDTELSADAMALSNGRAIIMGCYYSGSYRCIAIEFGGTSNSHTGAGRGYILLKSSKQRDMWSANADINVKRSIRLKYTVSDMNAVLNFDNEEISGSVTAGTMSAKSNIRMFLDARTSSVSAIQYPIRIYSAQIKVAGELVRDFIPVIDSDGVACMYDKVTKEYYYNKGTGSFIAGYK